MTTPVETMPAGRPMIRLFRVDAVSAVLAACLLLLCSFHTIEDVTRAFAERTPCAIESSSDLTAHHEIPATLLAGEDWHHSLADYAGTRAPTVQTSLAAGADPATGKPPATVPALSIAPPIALTPYPARSGLGVAPIAAAVLETCRIPTGPPATTA